MPKEKQADKKIEPEILTFTEAHQFLRVSHQTLYRFMEDGLISHKIGKKRVFFKEDLVEWIKKH